MALTTGDRIRAHLSELLGCDRLEAQAVYDLLVQDNMITWDSEDGLVLDKSAPLLNYLAIVDDARRAAEGAR